MSIVKNIGIGLKAIIQLSPAQTINYLSYQAGLRSGYYHFKTPSASMNRLLPDEAFLPECFMDQLQTKTFSLFSNDYQNKIIKEADEIVKGNVRLFGAEPVPLNLTIPGDLAHWTLYETEKVRLPCEDIKFIWEPARFGWAITLGKAYLLTDDKCYPRSFWKNIKEFNQTNPLNKGPNWQSGQEVALRLISLVIALNLLRLFF